MQWLGARLQLDGLGQLGALGQLTSLSVPEFLHLYNKDDNYSYLMQNVCRFQACKVLKNGI